MAIKWGSMTKTRSALALLTYKSGFQRMTSQPEHMAIIPLRTKRRPIAKLFSKRSSELLMRIESDDDSTISSS